MAPLQVLEALQAAPASDPIHVHCIDDVCIPRVCCSEHKPQEHNKPRHASSLQSIAGMIVVRTVPHDHT